MIDSKQFRALVVKPTLKTLEIYSQELENLLVMTMAHESNGGQYLAQVGSGPALGIYQMEKGTFNDLWKRTLKDQKNKLSELYPLIMQACNLGKEPEAEEMEGDLILATCMSAVFYLRIKEEIPNDIEEMSKYCKKYWNTELGKATPDDYLVAYLKFDKKIV